MRIQLEPFQAEFLGSEERFPAMITAVATGKTLMMLLKDWYFCEKYPDTLSLIVRKEYTDLRDSTIKDFERYFNVKINSNKDFVHPNGSVQMFRHGAELNVLKNINLTRWSLEQGEEFDSDEVFHFLRDRLRRDNAPYRQGCVIANANGHNWIWKQWISMATQHQEISKEKGIYYHRRGEYLGVEANTFANEKNVPADFIEDLKRMEVEAPAHYKQYVLNSHDVSDDEFILISIKSVEALQGITHYQPKIKRIVACDPAMGGDECPIQIIENGEVIDQKILHENDSLKIASEVVMLGNKWDVDDFAIDSIGVGKGVADAVNELTAKFGKTTYYVNSAEVAHDDSNFKNKRSEMWFYVMKEILDKKIPYPKDEELRRQLTALRYEPLKFKGKLKLEDKQITKARLGCSPDRADAFVYGLYHLQFVKTRESKLLKRSSLDGYHSDRSSNEENLTVCNF